MVVLEGNMKRAVLLMLAVLMTALSIFAVSTSAQTAPVQNDRPYTCDIGADAAIITTVSHALLDVQSATEFDADEIKEDGINTRVATVWIVCICVLCFAAVIAFVVVMAKRNRGEKESD